MLTRTDRRRFPVLFAAIAVLALACAALAATFGLFGSDGPPSAYAQTDTTAPTISSVAITSDPDENDADLGAYEHGGPGRSSPRSIWASGVYRIGDDVEVTVTFSENVTVTGSPQLELAIGSNNRTAEYDSTDGSAAIFSYTVSEGDSDSDGIAIGANKLTLNGGSIKDAADNDASLAHNALPAQDGHKVDGVRPRLMGVRFLSSSDGSDGAYSAGEELMIIAEFNSDESGQGPIRGSASAQVKIDLGDEEKAAAWDWSLRFNDTRENVAYFAYVVQEGDLDSDGPAISANSVELNGGFIRDAAGNDAVLTHEAVATGLHHIVDAVAPTVSSIAITSDPGDDDTYGSGDKIEVTVTFSEKMSFPISSSCSSHVVHCEAELELAIGGTARTAAYQSHDGAEAVYAYTVQAGDSDDNGIAIGANKLTGQSIRDAAGRLGEGINDADLSHDAVAADSGHKVDGGLSSALTVSGDVTIRIQENRPTYVARYEVSGRNGSLTWSLTGDDSDDFTIIGGLDGLVNFRSSPNFEAPTDADADNEYEFTVNASDGMNDASLHVTVVVTNERHDADELPVITGTAQVGQTLTVDNSPIGGTDENTTFYYAWYRTEGDTDTHIDGATSSSYTVTDDDEGKTIKVVVSFRTTAGERVSLTSAPTEPITAEPVAAEPNNPATGTLTISGTAQVGETLTAHTSGISDANGLTNVSYSYQWIRNDGNTSTEIAEETASTYTLVSSDEGKNIRVRVSFTDDAGNEESLTSAATDAVAAAPPPPPDNVRAVTQESGAVELTWEAPQDATVTGYRIERSRADENRGGQQRSNGRPRDNHTLVEDTGSAETGYTDKSAEKGVEYEYRVSARNEAGPGEASGWVRANSPATGLPAISGTAQVGETLTADTSGIADADGMENDEVSFQWTAYDNAAGRYLLMMIEWEGTYIIQPRDVGMAIRVIAIFTDDRGNTESLKSAPTEPVAAAANPTVPEAPAHRRVDPPLGVAPQGSGELEVSWTWPGYPYGAGGSVITGGKVQWKEAADSWDTDADVSEALIPGDCTLCGYTIAGLTNGVAYTARVFATNAIGDSPPSDELTSTPTDGTTFTLSGITRTDYPEDESWFVVPRYTVTGARATITWSLSGDDSDAFSISTGGSLHFTRWGSYENPTDADRDNQYQVTVQASDGTNMAALQVVVVVISRGRPIINGDAQVGQPLIVDTLGITDANGLHNPNFTYQWIANDGTTNSDIAGATNSTYQVVAANAGKTIKVRVSFTDDAGNEESLTSASTTAVAAAPPPPPDNVRAVTQESGAVELTWEAPQDATVTGYRIERSRADGNRGGQQRSDGNPRAHHTLVEDTGSADTGYTDKSVEKGVEYEYRVSARNEAGTGEASEWVRAGPEEEPVLGDGLPGAPRNLTATPGNKEITLSWDPPADNGNAPATRYRIEWRVDVKDYDQNHWGTARSTTYTTNDQANLANGVKYFFRVRAGNGSGNSYGPYGPASEEVSATPTSGSAVDLGTPVLSNTENLHHGMVRLDWQDVEDVGWYVVQYYHLEGGEWLDLPAEGVDIAFHGSRAVVSNLHGLSWLRVRAMSCAGESEWSQIEQLFGTNKSDWEGVPVPDVEEGDEIEPCPVVLGTPVLPDTETLHHGMVQLDWQDIEDAGWYVVQYYHLEGGEWLDLPAAGVEIAFHGSSAVVSNLHGLSWLRVGAASCAGESEWSQIEELYGTKESDWEGVPVPEVEEGDEIEPCDEDLDTPENSPATGAPTITGTARVGEGLEVDTSGIADADGLTNVAFTYQWITDDAVIVASAARTYTPTDGDRGKSVKVRVSFTDDTGNPETRTSANTATVEARANSPATGLPTINGTAQVGQTLTANTSGVADADGLSNVQYEYQWLADDSDISGATNATYTLVADDEGKAIKVRVSFTDDAGNNEETLTSAATEAVAAAPTPNSPATGAPTIIGTAQVRETLTAGTSNIADDDGLANVSFSYQWLADDTEVQGTTNADYTLADADEGQTIKVRVFFSDDAGNNETLTSAPTAAVAAPAQADSEDEPAISYITVVVAEDTSDPDNTRTDFKITWSDVDDCSTEYNAYLNSWTYANGRDRTHLGSAATDGSQITSSLSNVEGEGAIFDVELYCGTEDSGRLVSSVSIPHDDGRLVSSTYTSEPPLTALTVSPGTLTPTFHSHTLNYTVPDVVSADDRLTLVATAKPDYRIVFVKHDAWGVATTCDLFSFSCDEWHYQDGDGNPVYPLTDADADAPGFQVDLAAGEKLAMHVLHDYRGRTLQMQFYGLTVTRASNSPATGLPTIDGTAQVGETLTASTSDIEDADGLTGATFSYQWLSSRDTEIQGATDAAYILVPGDAGKTIKVKVSFTDDEGNAEMLTSAATDAVSPAPTPNNPATGAPTISGTAQVGETLAAETSGINDDDGLDNVAYTYQWLSSRDTEIQGATDRTYTLAATDEGKAIKVRVSFTDDANNQETLTSAATAAVAAAPTPNSPATGAPTIIGTAQVRETLTAGTSNIADADGLGNVQYEYQWLADDAEIAGATSLTYTLADTDEGKAIKVEVTFTDDDGNAETLTSAGTDAVAAAPTPNSPATGAPTITGTAQVGETLTADTSGIADADGLSSVQYEYQWLADGSEIAGATSLTYTLADTEEGKAIKVQVSFTDDAGNEETLTSAATDAVAAAPTLNSPVTKAYITVVIASGDDTVSWSDPDGCSSDYNIYKAITPYASETSHIHLVSAAPGSAQATLDISHSEDDRYPAVEVELYCGTYDAASSQNLLISSAQLSISGTYLVGINIREGTYSSAPLTALAISSGMLSPDFDRGPGRYSAEVPSDVEVITLDPTVLTGYQTDFVKNPDLYYTVTFCRNSQRLSCVYSYGDGTTTGIVLSDADTDTEGFQINLDPGENRLGIGVHKGPVAAGPARLYPLTITRAANTPATGQPTINGTAQVGEVLEVDTSGIADADGLANVTFSYQWLSSRDTEIGGATSSTYTLQASDESKAVKVQVSFTDDAGNDESLTSAATDAVSAAPTPDSPATGSPTINGTAQVGETLTADTSGIADADGLSNVQYEYQWLADDSDIAGATGLTYTLADDDEGKVIKVRVSFTDDAGNEETPTSAATDAVAAAPTPNTPATGAPTITGTVQVGETLTANTSGIADADGLSNVQYEYQWLADGSEISGATNATYILVDVDEGKAIKVEVSFTDDAGNGETLTSAATDAVATAEPSEPPDKPRGLEATSTHDSVTLTWDDPQDESITGYVILRRVPGDDPEGHFDVLVADTGTAATTYTDDTVKAETRYTYRIKAINQYGASERSRWVHIDTPAPPVPDKPRGLEATASNGQVVLTWDDPDDESITGYVILRRIPGDDPEGHFDVLVADTGSAATTYTDDTVAAETRYTYRIKAINQYGASERSRWVHIDTPAAP